MEVSSIFLLLLVIFLVGYSAGRRIGLQEGKKEGLALSPLELKRQSLERGRCVICGMPKRKGEIE